MIKDHKVKRYFKNPKIPILLHEEVEPVGHIFNAIVLFSSSLLIQKTSQRALLLDGAKSDAVLVVNTSLFPDDVIKLVKKYNLSQNWFGKVVTIKTSKIDKSPSYPLLGALARAWEKIDLETILDALEILGKKNKKDSVKRGYDDSIVEDVNLESMEKSIGSVEIPVFDGNVWRQEIYYAYQKAAANAKNYLERISTMPRWELLIPGLIEFGPYPGNKNIGFTTPWRFIRPILNREKCIDCKLCSYYCPNGAIDFKTITFDYDYCTGCGICKNVCPTKAIELKGEIEAVEGLKDDELPTKRFESREYGF
ncbi:MAG: 4Fe-4S binding protein [Thermoplasmata archaeon]